MIITARVFNPKYHTVTRRFTSRQVIARLAGLLNGLPASPGLAISCPVIPVGYRVGFAATAHGLPGVVAEVGGGCLDVPIAVGGKQQPVLWGSYAPDEAVSKLLPVKRPLPAKPE